MADSSSPPLSMSASPTAVVSVDSADPAVLAMSLSHSQALLRRLVAHELERLLVWRDPTFSRPPLAFATAFQPDTAPVRRGPMRVRAPGGHAARLPRPRRAAAPGTLLQADWPTLVRFAWMVDPEVAVRLSERFTDEAVARELRYLVFAAPWGAIGGAHGRKRSHAGCAAAPGRWCARTRRRSCTSRRRCSSCSPRTT